MFSQKVKIRCAEMEFKDGIAYIKIFENADIDIEELKEIYTTGNSLSLGKPFCALIDARGNPNSTPEARNYAANHASFELRLADAIIVDSTMMKLVVNIYINFNKPKVPTRMFHSEEEAKKWLMEFLPKA
jgi:hypothetical protein